MTFLLLSSSSDIVSTITNKLSTDDYEACSNKCRYNKLMDESAELFFSSASFFFLSPYVIFLLY